MGISKVQIGEETLIDLTGDTVNPQVLLKGATAHGANGEPVEGAMTAVPTTTSLAVTEEGVSALDGTVGKALDDKGSQIAFYQDTDNAWHFRDWNGADTVIPFSNSYPETYDFTIKSVWVQNTESYTIAACETTIPGGIYKYAKVVNKPYAAKINDEELTVNELYTIPDTNDDLQLYLSIRYSRLTGKEDATLTLYQNMPTN